MKYAVLIATFIDTATTIKLLYIGVFHESVI